MTNPSTFLNGEASKQVKSQQKCGMLLGGWIVANIAKLLDQKPSSIRTMIITAVDTAGKSASSKRRRHYSAKNLPPARN
jgi:hypothetical protein